VAEYALWDMNKSIGISRYALAATLPEELQASFPTVEEVEAELGQIMVPLEEEETSVPIQPIRQKMD